jgi:hypothetical protein
MKTKKNSKSFEKDMFDMLTAKAYRTNDITPFLSKQAQGLDRYIRLKKHFNRKNLSKRFVLFSVIFAIMVITFMAFYKYPYSYVKLKLNVSELQFEVDEDTILLERINVNNISVGNYDSFKFADIANLKKIKYQTNLLELNAKNRNYFIVKPIELIKGTRVKVHGTQGLKLFELELLNKDKNNEINLILNNTIDINTIGPNYRNTIETTSPINASLRTNNNEWISLKSNLTNPEKIVFNKKIKICDLSFLEEKNIVLANKGNSYDISSIISGYMINLTFNNKKFELSPFQQVEIDSPNGLLSIKHHSNGYDVIFEGKVKDIKTTTFTKKSKV